MNVLLGFVVKTLIYRLKRTIAIILFLAVPKLITIGFRLQYMQQGWNFEDYTKHVTHITVDGRK